MFCDWKFENILIFDETLSADNAIKLCDFGAIQHCNVEIVNPQNFNPLFSSPYLSTPKIKPKFRDDWISVCYLFYKLNGFDLPWEIVTSGRDKDYILSLVLLLKMSSATTIDLKKTIYWPADKFFDLYKLV